MPPQGPPDFILHASKILNLSPELLRLAKRNESISPALRSQLLECFHRFLSLCPASYSSLMRLRGAGESDAAHDADMSSREILLKICTALILSRVWPLYTFKTYLKRLQTLTPHFDVGVPATLQLTALRSLSYSAQKCSYQSEEGSVSLHQLDELQRMTYRFNRILLKLKQLKQLEQSRLKRMQRILKDEFIVSLRLKHKEVVLSLAAFLPKLDSKEVLQSKLLHVAKAHKEAQTAALNEGEFIKWISAGEGAEKVAKDNKTTSSCSPPTDLIRRRAVSTLQNLDPLVNRVLLSKDSAESLHLRQQLPSLLRVIHHQLSAKHAQLASLCQDIDENAEKRVIVEDCSIQFINRLVGLCEFNNMNDVEALLAERRSRSEETIASLMNLVNRWSPFEPVLR